LNNLGHRKSRALLFFCILLFKYGLAGRAGNAQLSFVFGYRQLLAAMRAGNNLKVDRLFNLLRAESHNHFLTDQKSRHAAHAPILQLHRCRLFRHHIALGKRIPLLSQIILCGRTMRSGRARKNLNLFHSVIILSYSLYIPANKKTTSG
jgi:hypothetical protein